MWIRLLKASEVGKKKYPVGRVLRVINPIASQMIVDKKATEYIGGFPPQKMKLKLDSLNRKK